MKKFLALIIALPLFAGGEAWLNIGYGTASQAYDSTGSAKDMGGSYSALNLYLGGSYDFYSLPAATFFGGADFRLSQHSFSPDTGKGVSSGFSFQNLIFFFGVKGPFYKGKFGFLIDLGPKWMEDTTVEFGNTDEQNALMLSFDASVPHPMFALSAGFSLFITFQKSTKFYGLNAKVDQGDFLAFYPKLGYKFAVGEAGLELLYRIRSTGKLVLVDYNMTLPIESSNQFSLIPYVVINPPALPVSFFIKGSIVDEYLPYGFSLMGKNEPVTRLGFTLGGKIRF